MANTTQPGDTSSNARDSIQGTWDMRDWRHDYNEDSQSQIALDKKETLATNVKLSQSGDEVTGQFTNSRGQYELTGVVHDGVFSGSWSQIDADRSPWHGSFQFTVLPHHHNGNAMLGRWVGLSSDYAGIHCGEWEWVERVDPGLPPKRDWPSEAPPSVPFEPKPRKEFSKKYLGEHPLTLAGSILLLGIGLGWGGAWKIWIEPSRQALTQKSTRESVSIQQPRIVESDEIILDTRVDHLLRQGKAADSLSRRFVPWQEKILRIPVHFPGGIPQGAKIQSVRVEYKSGRNKDNFDTLEAVVDSNGNQIFLEASVADFALETVAHLRLTAFLEY